MKILQISPYFYPSYRGTEQTVANLSEILTRLGHEVDILTVNTEGVRREEVWKGKIRVYRGSFDLRYHRAVFSHELAEKLLAARDYDIYHIHIPFHGTLELSILASKVNKIPIVATHHGEGPPVGLIHGFLNLTYNHFYRIFSLPQVKRIIFFTQSYPHSLGLREEILSRVKVIKPAVDISTFSPYKKDEALRRKHNFNADDLVVLFVATLTPWERRRGTHLLIKAMKAVGKEIPKAKLVVVGGNGLLPSLKRFAEKLKLGDQICFAGRIGRDEMPLYYAMCDLFVFPSMYESFGYVVLEAMASGKPVVVSDIPGVGELVKTGVTGLKVPPGDIKALTEAIIFLLKNEDLRHEIAINARREVEKRSWSDVANEVINVYREVLYNPTSDRNRI